MGESVQEHFAPSRAAMNHALLTWAARFIAARFIGSDELVGLVAVIDGEGILLVDIRRDSWKT